MDSRFVQTRDIRMHYYHAGAGEPVILIHGFPEDAYEWRHQLPALGERFEVFAIDTRGHGQSDKPTTGYTRADLAQDVVNFMDALGLDTARVVAHDWGGIIAVKLVLDHGERVSRLALIDTICTGWPGITQYFYWFQAPGLAEQFFPKYAREFIRQLIDGGGDVPPAPESPWQMAPVNRRWATPEDIDHFAAAVADPGSWAADCRYYREMRFHRITADPAAFGGERYERVLPQEMAARWLKGEAGPEYLDYGVEDRAKQYGGPVLWIYSSVLAQAPGITVLPDGRLAGDPAWDSFTRHFPRLECRMADSGHFIPEEAPEWTNEQLLRFLA